MQVVICQAKHRKQASAPKPNPGLQETFATRCSDRLAMIEAYY